MELDPQEKHWSKGKAFSKKSKNNTRLDELISHSTSQYSRTGDRLTAGINGDAAVNYFHNHGMNITIDRIIVHELDS